MIKNRKLEKFEVPLKDKEVSYRRKSKKYNKTLKKYNIVTRRFSKGEAIFNKWLEENRARFNVKLIKKSSWEFYFEGVVKNISLFVNGMPETGVSFEYFDDEHPNEDPYFDHNYIEYIGSEAYHPQKGYYDSDRVDNIYTYFPTREELYINEVFEKIITYCNTRLVPENSVYLGDLDGMRIGFIASSDETDNKAFKRHFGASVELRNCLVGCDGEKLFSNEKSFRCIKYDLFDKASEPSIRYFERN